MKTISNIFQILKDSRLQYRFKAVDELPKETSDPVQPVFSRKTTAAMERVEKALQQGNLDQARKRLLRLRKTYSNHYYLSYLEGQLARHRKQPQEALRHYFHSVRDNRAFAPAWKAIHDLGYTTEARRRVQERAWIGRHAPGIIHIYYDRSYKKDKKYYPWMTFAMGSALWRFEGLYFSVFPQARFYRPSFQEKLFCYRVLLFTWRRAKRNKPNLKDSDMDYLLVLENADMLAGYVFFESYRQVIRDYNRDILKKHAASIRKYFHTIVRRSS